MRSLQVARACLIVVGIVSLTSQALQQIPLPPLDLRCC